MSIVGAETGVYASAAPRQAARHGGFREITQPGVACCGKHRHLYSRACRTLNCSVGVEALRTRASAWQGDGSVDDGSDGRSGQTYLRCRPYGAIPRLYHCRTRQHQLRVRRHNGNRVVRGGLSLRSLRRTALRSRVVSRAIRELS